MLSTDEEGRDKGTRERESTLSLVRGKWILDLSAGFAGREEWLFGRKWFWHSGEMANGLFKLSRERPLSLSYSLSLSLIPLPRQL